MWPVAHVSGRVAHGHGRDAWPMATGQCPIAMVAMTQGHGPWAAQPKTNLNNNFTPKRFVVVCFFKDYACELLHEAYLHVFVWSVHCEG